MGGRELLQRSAIPRSKGATAYTLWVTPLPRSLCSFERVAPPSRSICRKSWSKKIINNCRPMYFCIHILNFPIFLIFGIFWGPHCFLNLAIDGKPGDWLTTFWDMPTQGFGKIWHFPAVDWWQTCKKRLQNLQISQSYSEKCSTCARREWRGRSSDLFWMQNIWSCMWRGIRAASRDITHRYKMKDKNTSGYLFMYFSTFLTFCLHWYVVLLWETICI